MEHIIETLKEGGIILYPSDTIWALGCDATNESACQKLMALKNRPDDKSFIILVDGFQMIEKHIPDFPDVCYDLVDFADKPLTVIYPDAKRLAPSILAADGSVGIRVTKDPSCLKLIRAMRRPLVSTSANISGEANPTCFDDVNQKLKEGVDAIVMERLTEKNTAVSQIIKIGVDYSVEIIRK
ncbi:MAG: L-threonylcarbamoyladenylate synthase [Crocinitomicaceae bacterium]|nr:L-threonylcarbamoyladenylate synthase [Crocinitomicaceae bacterium]